MRPARAGEPVPSPPPPCEGCGLPHGTRAFSLPAAAVGASRGAAGASQRRASARGGLALGAAAVLVKASESCLLPVHRLGSPSEVRSFIFSRPTWALGSVSSGAWYACSSIGKLCERSCCLVRSPAMPLINPLSCANQNYTWSVLWILLKKQ